jgi:hypothetical protein
MAERRMFTKKVTDDDNFMSLSASAQALYLHLSMSADDDGFCNQISASMFKAHASVQDLEALLSKRYVYQFENGVIVIKHWRMANALRKDRYTPTAFQEELKQLKIKENGAYTMGDGGLVATWLPDGCQMVAERLPDGCQMVAERLPDGCQMVATGKDSIDKNRLDYDSLDSFCGEPDEPTTPPEEIFIKIPLIDKTEFDVPESLVAEYQETYPALDIRQKLRSMRQWCIDNPTKRKTRRGIRKFIGGWLEREQNSGRFDNRTQSQKPKDSFKNYEERNVDYEKLLGNGGTQ